MESLHLTRIRITTPAPAVLERFVSEVLALEVGQEVEGLFDFQISDLRVEVFEGVACPIQFDLVLGLDEVKALEARLEFFRFRQECEHLVQTVPGKILLSGPDGISWNITEHHTLPLRMSTTFPVRNC